jgi:hypothetical protein
MFLIVVRHVLAEVKVMGYGSAGTPPWVDEEHVDDEKAAAKIKALEKENETLKKRIKQLEEELKKLKK